MSLVALDTNILVYSMDKRALESKRHLAQELLSRIAVRQNGILPGQALVEFYAVVTRKHHGAPEDAARQVTVWGRLLTVVGTSFDDVAAAIQAHRDHGLPIWDAMI